MALPRIARLWLASLLLLAQAGSARATSPAAVSLEFHPPVADIGQPVVISVSTTNTNSTAVVATITLSLEVSGTSYTVAEDFSLSGGEGTCAEFTMTPELPGVIRITAQVNVVETESKASDTLWVLPGGSESPFEDLPALGDSILNAFNPCGPTPVEPTSWGAIKSRYR